MDALPEGDKWLYEVKLDGYRAMVRSISEVLHPSAGGHADVGDQTVHPHSMRHSTAVHLLRSGVDIVTISQWLGHANVTTTNRYATVDIEMNRKAIEQARPITHGDAGVALWRTDASILEWLEEL